MGFEVDDDLPAPLCKVNASTIMQPGRCFTSGSSRAGCSAVSATESSKMDFPTPTLPRGMSTGPDSDPDDSPFRAVRKASGSPQWVAWEAPGRQENNVDETASQEVIRRA